MAHEQARNIVAELVKQQGPDTYALPNGKEIDMAETKIIALIAYVQRLGTDISAPPSAPATEPGKAPTDQPEASSVSQAESQANQAAAPASSLNKPKQNPIEKPVKEDR